MSYARIPNFSQPVPVRSTSAHTSRRRLSTDGRYLTLPNEPLPGEDEVWVILEPVRPETAHSRGYRFLEVAGELLAAIAIIGGGMLLTGLASLL